MSFDEKKNITGAAQTHYNKMSTDEKKNVADTFQIYFKPLEFKDDKKDMVEAELKFWRLIAKAKWNDTGFRFTNPSTVLTADEHKSITKDLPAYISRLRTIVPVHITDKVLYHIVGLGVGVYTAVLNDPAFIYAYDDNNVRDFKQFLDSFIAQTPARDFWTLVEEIPRTVMWNDDEIKYVRTIGNKYVNDLVPTLMAYGWSQETAEQRAKQIVSQGKAKYMLELVPDESRAVHTFASCDNNTYEQHCNFIISSRMIATVKKEYDDLVKISEDKDICCEVENIAGTCQCDTVSTLMLSLNTEIMSNEKRIVTMDNKYIVELQNIIASAKRILGGETKTEKNDDDDSDDDMDDKKYDTTAAQTAYDKYVQQKTENLNRDVLADKKAETLPVVVDAKYNINVGDNKKMDIVGIGSDTEIKPRKNTGDNTKPKIAVTGMPAKNPDGSDSCMIM
jgi:hypothetical protein